MTLVDVWNQTKLDDRFTFFSKCCHIFENSKCTKLHHVTASSRSGKLVEATRQSLLRSVVHCWPWLWIFQCESRFLCVYVCTSVQPVCVQAPLESINPKSNRLTAEAAFDVCWIPLWNIGCCFNNIQFLFPHQESIVLFSRGQTHTHTYDARIVQ